MAATAFVGIVVGGLAHIVGAVYSGANPNSKSFQAPDLLNRPTRNGSGNNRIGKQLPLGKCQCEPAINRKAWFKTGAAEQPASEEDARRGSATTQGQISEHGRRWSYKPNSDEDLSERLRLQKDPDRIESTSKKRPRN